VVWNKEISMLTPSSLSLTILQVFLMFPLMYLFYNANNPNIFSLLSYGIFPYSFSIFTLLELLSIWNVFKREVIKSPEKAATLTCKVFPIWYPQLFGLFMTVIFKKKDLHFFSLCTLPAFGNITFRVLMKLPIVLIVYSFLELFTALSGPD